MLKVIKNNTFIKISLLIVLLGGILLLNPQQLSSDSNEEAMKIKNQIEIIKENIEDHILENDYEVPGQKVVSFEDTIKNAMDEGKLFDSMGIVKNDHERVSNNTYFELDSEFTNSQIDTPFSGIFISTNNGDILYIQK